MEFFETALSTVGLGHPVSRFFAVTAVGTGVEFLVKPSWSFGKDGNPLPWTYISPVAGSTSLPVGLLPAVVGLVAFLFI